MYQKGPDPLASAYWCKLEGIKWILVYSLPIYDPNKGIISLLISVFDLIDLILQPYLVIPVSLDIIQYAEELLLF
jgi:hypothetical protein